MTDENSKTSIMPTLWDICVKDRVQLSKRVPNTKPDQCAIALEAIHKAISENDTTGCFGLAANQLGIDARVFIIKINNPDGKPTEIEFCNPDIVGWGGSAMNQEWCYSLGPQESYIVRRHANIKIQDDKHGITLLKGIAAYAAQHEIDHLNGKLICDKGIAAAEFIAKAMKTSSQPQNSLCRCGSNKKYKRCCGKDGVKPISGVANMRMSATSNLGK